MTAADRTAPPRLSGVVVHWHDEERLAALIDAWPRDPRFELIVVDNGGTLAAESSPGVSPIGRPGLEGRIVRPDRNLGFAGGANRGAAEARSDVILLLNPDAVPEPGALDALLDGFAAHPEAAGLAPRLEDGVGDVPNDRRHDGSNELPAAGPSQHRWQLGRLPSPGRLVLEGLFLPARGGPDEEPPAGTLVEQPAAAALAVRREEWQDVGGMDPGFYPAWFEDVDLARRLRSAGALLLYWPAARFRHALGSTVPRLGYGRFLFIYYRNLTRYLRKHHGPAWAAAARVVLPIGMLLRLALLPLRRPRRATGRSDAARGLLAVLAGALSGWRRPRALAEATDPSAPGPPHHLGDADEPDGGAQ